MSRDDGFAIADVDVGYLDDSKVRALVRLLPDRDRVYHALVLHFGTLLASWADSKRLTVRDGAPIWAEVDEELVAALIEVGMFDEEARIPAHAFQRFHGVAFDRREKTRERWRRWKAGQDGEVSRPEPHVGQTPEATLDRIGSNVGAVATNNGQSAHERAPSVRPSGSSGGSPQPPAGGGRRSNGTSPRQLATAADAASRSANSARRWRRQQRQLAYARGAITEAQQLEMNARDAPLEELPDWIERLTSLDPAAVMTAAPDNDELPPFLRGELEAASR